MWADKGDLTKVIIVWADKGDLTKVIVVWADKCDLTKVIVVWAECRYTNHLVKFRQYILCILVLGYFKISAVIYCKMLLNVRCC